MKQYIAHLTVTRSFAVQAWSEEEAIEKAEGFARSSLGVSSKFWTIEDVELDESSAFDETKTST